MSFSTRAMFLLVAVIAASIALFRAFLTYDHFIFGIYVVLTAVVIVGAIPRRALLRPGFIGAAIFGLIYLVFDLWGRIGVNHLLGEDAGIGCALLGLAFMASQLCAMLVWPRSDN